MRAGRVLTGALVVIAAIAASAGTATAGSEIESVELSGNGDFAAISAGGDRLEVREAATGKSTALGGGYTEIGDPSISTDGRTVAFAAKRDRDAATHAYVWHVDADTVERASHAPVHGDVELSGDAGDLGYVHNGHIYLSGVASGEPELIDTRAGANEPSNGDRQRLESVSEHGHYVLFTSDATDLGTTCAASECAYRRIVSADATQLAEAAPH